MAVKQRAYSNEQKLERQTTILLAAEKLFGDRRYEQVTMLDIAKCAGVSKGTLYVYFETKEALFLVYAKQHIDRFFARLQQLLDQHTDALGAAGVVNAIGQAYSESKQMVRLLTLLHQVLESNAGFDNALAFRRGLIPLLECAGAECERHLWFLDKGMGARLLLTIHSVSLGLQQLADPSETIQKVEQQPDMTLYQFDFETSFISTIDCLLAGMEARARQKNS
jgi:AcrR family transcriptional regulator